MSEVKLNLIVLKTPQLGLLREFSSALGVSFVEESHGNGPLHLAARVGDVVLEAVPAGRRRQHPAGLRGAGPRRGAGEAECDRGQQGSPDGVGRRAVARDPDRRKIELVEA
jgi:hypothetical protein